MMVFTRRTTMLVALGASLMGCVSPPIGTELCRRPKTDEPVDVRVGAVENGVYMSSDWGGELLYFPGGSYYRFYHQLGETPRWWQVYLAFDREGLPSSVSEAAGNQAQLQAIDDETITILNGSCVEYWMLLTAGASAQQ
ncbi:MAG TPA: hypothetical protein ENK23_07030 [Sorangium sp.]|nr:hypothetical protein [Sorangium sp.]